LRGFLIRRVNCPDAAEDILQDTYFKLTQSETESNIRNPKAFLYRIVSNLAIDYLRKAQRETARYMGDSELPEAFDTAPTIEQQIYTLEQIAQLKLAVAELPPRCRQVFIMHKFKQYPYSQIMRELGIAESTVLKHIVKAMEHCRRRMQELDALGD
jgi:RNA polymerase sigma-70 factor (ECF subfamily)